MARAFDRRKIVLVTLLVVLAACGSEHPTAPRIVEPSPQPPLPPPAVEVDWNALSRLFDDPFFVELPHLLENQEAALPIEAAVSGLIAGIRGRNLETVERALVETRQTRASYFARPDYQLQDRAVLLAISLFEMRGWGFMPASIARPTELPLLKVEGGL